jgi:hypothetical protein
MEIKEPTILLKRRCLAEALFSKHPLTAQPDEPSLARSNYLYEQEYAPYLQSKEYLDRTRRLKMLGQIGIFPTPQDQPKIQEPPTDIPIKTSNECEVLANVVSTHLHSTLKKRTIKPKFHPQWKLMRVISGYICYQTSRMGKMHSRRPKQPIFRIRR